MEKLEEKTFYTFIQWTQKVQFYNNYSHIQSEKEKKSTEYWILVSIYLSIKYYDGWIMLPSMFCRQKEQSVLKTWERRNPQIEVHHFLYPLYKKNIKTQETTWQFSFPFFKELVMSHSGNNTSQVLPTTHTSL